MSPIYHEPELNMPKVCRRCNVEKPGTEFAAAPLHRDGLDSWCKQCHRDRAHDLYREVRPARPGTPGYLAQK